MSDVQSQLGRYQPKAATSDEGLSQLKRRAWRDRGVLVISPAQLTDAIDQAFVKGLGNRLYGRRRNDG